MKNFLFFVLSPFFSLHPFLLICLLSAHLSEWKTTYHTQISSQNYSSYIYILTSLNSFWVDTNSIPCPWWTDLLKLCCKYFNLKLTVVWLLKLACNRPGLKFPHSVESHISTSPVTVSQFIYVPLYLFSVLDTSLLI